MTALDQGQQPPDKPPSKTKGKPQLHRKHGLVALRRALQGSIRPDSKLGQILAQLRADLAADVGGPPGFSTAQRMVIERAVRHHLRAASIDAYLDTLPVEERLHERVLALEREGRAQSEALVRTLLALGLERRQPVKSLNEWMAEALAEPLASENATTSATEGQEHASEQPGESIHEENPETL
jgi:hypothetical protein